MEAHRHFGKLAGGRSQGLANRRNSILIAAVCAALAAVLVYLFVSHYSKATPATVAAPAQATVWEATHAIPPGTPEASIASDGYFKPVSMPAAQILPGAVTDPAQVVGEVTNVTIAAGQQVKVADFVKTPSVLAANLKGNQRAVAFSFDSEHGLSTWLAVGNSVDVMLALTKGLQAELVAQNVTVLENSGGLVVLKLTDRQALLLASASLKGTLWLTLRPSLNAKNSIKLYSLGS